MLKKARQCGLFAFRRILAYPWALPLSAPVRQRLFYLRCSMNPRHYRDLIIRAVGEADGKTLGLIVEHVIDAERAKTILRANGYGVAGMTSSATAALVPQAPPSERAQ